MRETGSDENLKEGMLTRRNFGEVRKDKERLETFKV